MAKNTGIPPNKNDHVQIDRIVIAGFFLIVIGGFAIGCTAYFGGAQWYSQAISSTGTGLVAGGLLTLILERSARRRHHEEISEIRSAQSDSILKGLMPELIFNQVRSHIIEQPFFRTKVEGAISLAWTEDRSSLIKTTTGSYEVMNRSKTMEVYHVTVELYHVQVDVEDTESAVKPGSAQISEITIEFESDPEVQVFGQSALQRYAKSNDDFAAVDIPIELKPNQRIKVGAKNSSIHHARDVHPFLVNKAAAQLTLTVTHPEDLNVSALALHPSPSALAQGVDDPTLKKWTIAEGMLPYQGIQLSWAPKAPAGELNEPYQGMP